MDEGMLNDLLECSVCLERLDTSSKVLPCQHTFCRKCLEEIVSSHTELRCPECRVLVEVKIDELPPNVLLMRILEGMRNAAPKKLHSRGSPRPQAHTNISQSVSGGAKILVPLNNQPHARAVYDYQGKEPGDLTFQKGEIVLLRRRIDSHWFYGEAGGREGAFPVTYVHVLLPLPSPTPQCRALYDFKMSGPEEEGCLCFRKGTVLQVIRRVDDNWAEGRINDKIGIFPIAFVEMNSVARALMKLSMNSQPGPSRIAPPTPPSEDVPATHTATPVIHTMSRSLPPGTGPPPPVSQPNMSHSHPPPSNYISQNMTPQHTHAQNKNSGPRNINVGDNVNIQPSHSASLAQSSVTSSITLAPSANKHPVTTTSTNQATNTMSAAVGNFSGSESSSSMSTMSSTTPNSSNSSSNSSTAPSSPTSPPTSVQPRQIRPQTTVMSLRSNNATPAKQGPQTSANPVNLSNTSPAQTTTTTGQHQGLVTSSYASPSTQNKAQNNFIGSQKTSPNFTQNSSNLLQNFEPHGASSSSALQNQLSPPPIRLPTTRDKEKRHSFTAINNTLHHNNQHRHSAEILSPCDITLGLHSEAVAKPQSSTHSHRRSQSNDLIHVSLSHGLPAAYVALYPYKPHKSDELELRKGGIYMVTERCQDGWFKGISNRTKKSGVFPGNYVAPARAQPRPTVTYTRAKQSAPSVPSSASSASTTVTLSSGTRVNLTQYGPPELPPRAASPVQGSSWHGTGDSSGASARPEASSLVSFQSTPKSSEKSKEKKDKGGVSLMKRLASMKRSKSPPPSPYFSDNPVFEDSSVSASPVHVRSGSCPSQLLQALPLDGTLAATVEGSTGVSGMSAPSNCIVQRLFGSCSNRTKNKERPSIIAHGFRSVDSNSANSTPTASTGMHHRKSHSLDAGNKHNKHPTIKERCRCIVAYPPNGPEELELRVNDIILVHRKHSNGWIRGTLQRTGRVGLFPASFVENI